MQRDKLRRREHIRHGLNISETVTTATTGTTEPNRIGKAEEDRTGSARAENWSRRGSARLQDWTVTKVTKEDRHEQRNGGQIAAARLSVCLSVCLFLFLFLSVPYSEQNQHDGGTGEADTIKTTGTTEKPKTDGGRDRKEQRKEDGKRERAGTGNRKTEEEKRKRKNDGGNDRRK